MKRIVLLNALIISLLLSCKKEAPKPPEVYYVHFRRDGLKYIELSKVNYLIYKDSATGELDSVVVTLIDFANYFSGQVYNSNIPAFYYQYFILQLHKVIDNFTDSVWFEGNAATFLDPPPYHSSDTGDIVMNERDNSTAFSFPPLSYPGNFLIPSIKIEGKTYTDVIEHIYENGLNIDDPKYKRITNYWAKEIGIIKREIITANGKIKTYTLIRNN